MEVVLLKLLVIMGRSVLLEWWIKGCIGVCRNVIKRWEIGKSMFRKFKIFGWNEKKSVREVVGRKWRFK